MHARSSILAPRWQLALLLPWALLTARFWFVCDDAYISFRYAQNLARGEGMVFNVGESPAVEGYSNFLWVLLAAAMEALSLDVRLVMPAVSAACGALLLLWGFDIARRLTGDARVAFAALLPLAMSPAMGVWSSSGLATMPFALVVLATFDLLVLQRGREAAAAVAACALLLLRSEGAAWVAVLVALAAAVRWARGERPTAEQAARFGLPVVGVLLVYQLWRLNTFGTLVPNTALVKVGLGPGQLVRGAKYVALFALSTVTPALLFVGLPRAVRAGASARAVAAMAVGFPVFAILVGGDFMPFGRMLFAGLPFAALLLAYALQGRADALRWGVGLGVLGLLPAADLHVVPEPVRAVFHMRLSDDYYLSEVKKWRNMAENAQGFELRGRALAVAGHPSDAVVSGAVGAISYHSDLWVWDTYGLVSKEVAYRPFHGPLRESPGHDKKVAPEYFAKYAPRFLYARAVKGRRAAQSMQDSLNRWAIDPLVMDQYVPDWIEVTLEGVPERTVLFVIRRVDPDDDPAALWRGFQARRKALHAELRAEAEAIDRDEG